MNKDDLVKIVESNKSLLIENVELKTQINALSNEMQNLRKTLDGIISTLLKVVEVRDPYTAGHQLKVAKIAGAIARKLELPEKQINNIITAASVHDIGKIYVPVEILNKGEKLSEVEFKLVEFHPSTGYNILKPIVFPFPIAEVVLQHHERLNGSGYPNGLKGNEIMLEAKIIAIADVVEAVTSHRPYRPAGAIYEAIDELSQNSGILYDPEAVIACIKVLTEDKLEF